MRIALAILKRVENIIFLFPLKIFLSVRTEKLHFFAKWHKIFFIGVNMKIFCERLKELRQEKKYEHNRLSQSTGS